MTDRPWLALLAEHCGIAASYVGYDGSTRAIDDAAREALLTAMGLDVSSESAAEDALQALQAGVPEQLLPPVRVVPAGAPELKRIEVRLGPHARGRLRYRLQLTLEDGDAHERHGEVDAEDALVLPMPAPTELTFGYHALRLEVDGAVTGATCTQDLIVVPGRCLSAPELIGERRALGVWTHVYTLASGHNAGVGDLRDLARLVRWAANQGLEFVGINPLHATDNDAGEVSPYYPLSRSFRNPIYIDLETAAARAGASDVLAQLSSGELAAEQAALRALPRVDYARVFALKRRVLAAIFAVFSARHRERGSALGRAHAHYQKREGRALTEFATFSALREQLFARDPSHRDFRQWPEPLRDPSSAAVARFASEQSDAIDFHAWLQFELDEQLAACQRAARGSGMSVGLYGDLAVGDAPFSAEVWARPELYARGVSIGAPPDPYSDTGQEWGITPLNPLALRADRYRAFRSLARRAFRHGGMLRIDHVMGLTRQFWVPAGKTAAHGAYVRFPEADLLGVLALESRRARALVVGEDLGVVPEGFRERMAERALLRSQVVYFERHGDGFSSPRDYARDALVTVSTHDLPPLAGFFALRDLEVRRRAGNIASDDALARAIDERRRAIGELLSLLEREGVLPSGGSDPQLRQVADAVHRLIARGAPRLVGLALDDLTLEEDALNTPATWLPATPNWSRRSRLPLEQLEADDGLRTALRDVLRSAGLVRGE